MTEENKMQITEKDRKRMNNKLFQFWRFIVLNLKILKAVDHSKRSWSKSGRHIQGACHLAQLVEKFERKKVLGISRKYCDSSSISTD